MGQAVRRATGRVRPGLPDPPPPPLQRTARNPAVDPPRPPPRTAKMALASPMRDITCLRKLPKSNCSFRMPFFFKKHDPPKKRGQCKGYECGVLEDQDPKYAEMLKHLVGWISSRPGGKLDMGEASIVERYNRPMPKLRSSRAEDGASGRKPLPPGTLSVEQVRQIILLHQGKSEDHPGPMDVTHIAKQFGVDAVQVQQIVQFMSLPPEDGKRKT